MTDGDFRALFDIALGAYSGTDPALSARFCLLWRQYVRWWRNVYQPQQSPRHRLASNAQSWGARPLVLKAQALGYMHAVGAVLDMAQRCGYASRRANGTSSSTAPTRQLGRGGNRRAAQSRQAAPGATTPARVSQGTLVDDETLSLD